MRHTYFQNGQVIRHDYGYMPVKNATRRDPRVHVAYLTTSSEGTFERQFEMPSYNQMVMRVRAETNMDTEGYTAFYKRLLG
ncbi:hypothetical protein OSTOST_04698 [Ostertagia ostertagi]